MSSRSPRKFRRRQQEGIALVVVLLFTAIVLTIIVSTTATLALGARGGGVNERASYQALLAAESGLNTFEVRVKALGKYPSNGSQAALDQWLTSNPSLKEYGMAKLGLKAAASGVTVTSTGSYLLASKQVLMDFELKSQSSYNINSDAALMSDKPVKVSGNADVEGESVNDSKGSVPVGEVKTTLNNLASLIINGAFTVSMSYQDKSDEEFVSKSDGTPMLKQGEYVTVGGLTYKVTGVDSSGNMTANVGLSLLPGLTLPSKINQYDNILRIDSAVMETTSVSLSETTTVIKVTDPTIVASGSKVNIAGYEAEVLTKDVAKNQITVKWTGTKPTTIPEGSALKKDIKAVISGGSITTNGSKTELENGQIANNPLFGRTNFNLFEYTFGRPKQEMLSSLERSTTAGDVDTRLETGKIAYYRGNLSYEGQDSFCGKGILIVDGDLKINKVCPDGFRGFIYVTGDFDQKGTAKFEGAVVVEGKTQTDVGSSGGGGDKDLGKIVYNREALLEFGHLLSPPTFKALQGTWRQQ